MPVIDFLRFDASGKITGLCPSSEKLAPQAERSRAFPLAVLIGDDFQPSPPSGFET
jgi:hypothetical protein